jgi:hypothetical protein
MIPAPRGEEGTAPEEIAAVLLLLSVGGSAAGPAAGDVVTPSPRRAPLGALAGKTSQAVLRLRIVCETAYAGQVGTLTSLSCRSVLLAGTVLRNARGGA